jgi:hypothetical protein
VLNGKAIFLVLASLLITACAAQNTNDINAPGALDLILCQEPRPQICTHEYRPVCATLKDGSRQTGATGCTSCSDNEVVGYRKGAC